MSRPRAFEEEVVLGRALELFRRKGFDGATIDELEAATGLGRGSLYATFGDKRQLFMRAFERYLGGNAEDRLTQLLRPEAGRADLVAFFSDAAHDALGDHERRGCLATNCAIELAAGDVEIATRVARHLDRFERSFETVVRQAQRRGEIPTGRDARRLARFLTVCLQGMQVLAKSRPDAAWLQDVVHAVDDALG